MTLKELADEVGVSHQALSEQLRRGIGALVEDTICIGTFPEGEEATPNARRATRAD